MIKITYLIYCTVLQIRLKKAKIDQPQFLSIYEQDLNQAFFMKYIPEPHDEAKKIIASNFNSQP